MTQEDSNDDIISHMNNQIKHQSKDVNPEKTSTLQNNLIFKHAVLSTTEKTSQVEAYQDKEDGDISDDILHTSRYSTFEQDIRYNLILIDYNKNGCINPIKTYENIVNYIINGLPTDNTQETE